jgi:hypothetical protein
VPGVASRCADADTKADVVVQLTPLLGQCSDSDTHFQRHLDSLERRAIDGNGIIEDHHHPVARVSFRGSVVPDNDLADGGMVHAAEPSRLPSPSFQRSRSMKVLGITTCPFCAHPQGPLQPICGFLPLGSLTFVPVRGLPKIKPPATSP